MLLNFEIIDRTITKFSHRLCNYELNPKRKRTSIQKQEKTIQRQEKNLVSFSNGIIINVLQRNNTAFVIQRLFNKPDKLFHH